MFVNVFSETTRAGQSKYTKAENIELQFDKPNKVACAPHKDSDQPGHLPSPIRVFAVGMEETQTLSYLSGKGCGQTGQHTYRISSVIRQSFFLFPKQSKRSRSILQNGSRSLGLFRMGKARIIAKISLNSIV